MQKPVKNLASFRATHDPDVIIPGKIRAALDSLAAEGLEAWEYEDDFRKRAGVNPADLARYREKFTAHQLSVRRVSHGSGSAGRKRWVWIGSAKARDKFLSVTGA